MREFNKIFALGLPRCGGQSLQQALADLLKIAGLNDQVWHSLYGVHWQRLKEDLAFVEIFAPISWLEKTYPNSLYILNDREYVEEWLRSCAKVYDRAVERDWKHPIWQYPLEAFEAYQEDYHFTIAQYLLTRPSMRDRVLLFTVGDGWSSLCRFLHVEEPTIPFPNIDKHGRSPLLLTSDVSYVGDVHNDLAFYKVLE